MIVEFCEWLQPEGRDTEQLIGVIHRHQFNFGRLEVESIVLFLYAFFSVIGTRLEQH